MVSEVEFTALVDRLVDDCLPEEAEAFDRGGDGLVRQVYRTGGAPPVSFGVITGGAAALKMIPVAVAAYKALREYLRPAPQPSAVSLEVVRDRFRVAVTAEGLSDAEAAFVADRFARLAVDLLAAKSAAGPATTA